MQNASFLCKCHLLCKAGLSLQRHLQNMLLYHKGLRVRKNPFPLSLAPGKP